MKKTILSATLAIMFLLCHSLSYAAINQFTGHWKNIDSNTRGITTLKITGNANALKMHAWGKCHPNDCDWGAVKAYAYAPNVSAPMQSSARAVSAIYTTSFSQTLVVVKAIDNNKLRAEVFTRFSDNSNRSNYTATYTFKRQLQVAPIKPMPIPVKPMMPAVREDCISFNPATTTLRNVDGRWTIVDGNHWMFNFGDKKAEAMKALRIIKHYKMNQSCFVGRPDPSFTYLLVKGKAPKKRMQGEDCVSFNPNTIEVKKINGRWKIVDGSHWIFDFENKEDEARTAFAIIKKYGFTRTCYVGRPNASFIYLRK
ncbi:MAG TPA: hypothetical protein ENL07_09520 [Chlorobaculum parvum]|uniref:Uncharacterized protein n=1 Tax=Chlorobaculum parvum TaxID=274539 RepID=A0A7C5DF46_9CHLB|nr:hypothetical protein [Chlorobaculum parvum]